MEGNLTKTPGKPTDGQGSGPPRGSQGSGIRRLERRSRPRACRHLPSDRMGTGQLLKVFALKTEQNAALHAPHRRRGPWASPPPTCAEGKQSS